MPNYQRIRKRKDSVKSRAASGAGPYTACRVFGCGKLTMAASGKGLTRLYCRRHEDHFQRHGSYVKPSYSATQIAPHRRAALAWLKANADLPRVRTAVGSTDNLMRSAGRAEIATRLRGRTPAERAKIAIARLREAKVDPRLIVATWLAVELAHRADPQPESKQEYRRVQVAKAIHRLASGTHRRWEMDLGGGHKHVTELHKYPASRGRVLRHIGRAIERTMEVLIDAHIDEIVAFKATRKRGRPRK